MGQINAQLMNMIPYTSGVSNPTGGFNFQGVTGVRKANPQCGRANYQSYALR